MACAMHDAANSILCCCLALLYKYFEISGHLYACCLIN